MHCIFYLHSKHLYYGDMKAANLLIFRDQRVKLGDLGISVRLDDKDVIGTDRKYYPKGMSEGYVTEAISRAIAKD